MNDDLVEQVKLQQHKKTTIQQFETILMKDTDYQEFLNVVKNEDKTLYEISQLFSDLTVEAKRILDDVKGKSDKRKEDFGETAGDKVVDHHKALPQEIKEQLLGAAEEVSKLFNVSSHIGQQLARNFQHIHILDKRRNFDSPGISRQSLG